MATPNQLAAGTPEALEEMLMPRVDVSEIASETDIDKVNALAFELYKETVSVVNLAASLIDETAAANGGWPRNEAICVALMIRISKFMLVVVELSATGNRAEVVFSLTRSIFESAINLEFLLRTSENKHFDNFVTSSLGPERELYDAIQANVVERGGEVWPIEQRMLNSIQDVCLVSGVEIENVKQRHGDWGGGVRERLKALGKEDRYMSTIRLPSHAVHGTWVDLYKNHLEHDPKTGLFSPDPRFSWVDERHMGPTALLILEVIRVYVGQLFAGISVNEILLNRIDDLGDRIHKVGVVHEELMNRRKANDSD